MPVLRKHIASAPFVGVPGVRHFSGDNALTDEWVKLDKSSFAPLADDDAGGAWATMPDDSRIATVEVINNSPDGGASIYVLFRDASGEDTNTPAIQVAPGQVLTESTNGLDMQFISVRSPGAGLAVGWAKIGLIA